MIVPRTLVTFGDVSRRDENLAKVSTPIAGITGHTEGFEREGRVIKEEIHPSSFVLALSRSSRWSADYLQLLEEHMHVRVHPILGNESTVDP
jgi:hypothetical protein